MGRDSHIWGNIVSKLNNMSIEEIEIADAFLRKHRALAEFKREHKRYNKDKLNYKEFMAHTSPRTFFLGAFSWEKSNKGGEFWLNLHYKYLKLFG